MKLYVAVFFTLTVCNAAAQDKSLDFYLKAALNSSPLLKDYNNQVRSNFIDSMRIKASYKPQVNGTSNNSNRNRTRTGKRGPLKQNRKGERT